MKGPPVSFRQSASFAVLAAALSLAACGGEETGANTDPASQGAPDSANDALAALGLAEQGRASWADRVQDGDTYTFTDFTLASEEGQLSAETLVLEDPRLSQNGPVFERLAVNTGEFSYDSGLASFSSFAIADAGPGVGQALANLIKGAGGLDDIPLDRQTFSGLTLDTLRVTTEASQEAGPGELVITRAEAGGFDGEVLERLTISDLAYDASDADGGQIAVDISEIAADGVNLALLESGAAGDLTGSNPLLGSISANYDQYDRVAVSGLRVVAGGALILMPEFIGEIDEASGGVFVSTAAMPALSLEANEDSPLGAQFAQSLDMLGYETLSLSLASETEYDPEADRLTTTGENYIAMEDGFTMTFEQDLSGIQAYTDAMNSWIAETEAAETGMEPALPPAVLEPLMIHSALIRLEDRSLLDRVLSMMAEQQGVTPAQLRSQAGLFVAMGAGMLGGSVPPELTTQLSGALTNFIGQGGALVVEFDPEDPVSAARFMAEDGPDLTGLAVRHEPAE